MSRCYPQHFIAACKDEVIRMKSSSGGIFTVLANYVFESDGVVFAASFDSKSYSIKHIMVSHPSELDRVRKSKYVWSDFQKNESEMLQKLVLGKQVLFVGTPCQVAHIKNKYGCYDNLLLVDLFCHGTADPVFFREYLLSIGSQINRVDFRGQSKTDRSNFDFHIESDGKLFCQPFGQNIFTRAFIESITIRSACFRCAFAEHPHIADITLGDFEWPHEAEKRGIDVLHPSIISVNTNKGRSVIQSVNEKIMKSDQITDAEISHYYRKHDYIGSWGYNWERKKRFEEDYKRLGFIDAVYKNIFPKEFSLIEKLDELMKRKNSNLYCLYGNGCVGKKVYEIISFIRPKWKLKSFIVTQKQEESADTSLPEYYGAVEPPVIEIKSGIEADIPVAIAVSDVYLEEVEKILKEYNIKNYVL